MRYRQSHEFWEYKHGRQRPRRQGLRRHRFPAVLIVLLFALVSACSGDSENSFMSMTADGDMEHEAPEPEPDSASMISTIPPSDGSDDAGDEVDSEPSSGDLGVSSTDANVAAAGAGMAVSTVATPAGFGRDIIYRATVTVKAPDVAAASREAVAIVQGLGGIVFGQETSTEPQPRTQMTFKVPPADFAVALERLAGVGELVDQLVSANDVTERIVNIESRITTAEASVVRLRRLLEQAANLDNVAKVERELLDRETTLETLRGSLRTLQDQVDLATITLTINQSPETRPDTGILTRAWVSSDSDDPCLGAKDIVVETGATVHFCLEVENRGEAVLTDVEIRSDILRLNMSSFQPVQGDFDRIEPGQFLVAVLDEPVVEGRLAGRVATRGLEIRIESTATPVDSDGAELRDVSDDFYVYVEVTEDDSRPGFADAVGAGVGALASMAGVVVVVVGVLVPFLPFIAVIAIAIWWLQRRRVRSNLQVPAGGETAPSQPAED